MGGDHNCDGTTLHIRIIDSKWLGTRPSPRPGQKCGEQANTEIQAVLDAKQTFSVDSPLIPFPCTRPATTIRKDCNGCYILEWNIDCNIRCENGVCVPQGFPFNIHGPYVVGDDPNLGRPPRFGISAYSLDVNVDVGFSMHCPCLYSACTVGIGMNWRSFAKKFDPTTEQMKPAVQPVKQDCLEADLSEMEEAYGCSKVVAVQ